MPFARGAGILLHPTSLPGGHGIGDLGAAAYRFLDQLAAARQSAWQFLPLGPTGDGGSPYQALSSFAGNPLLISLDRLVEGGLLQPDDIADCPFPDGAPVDFAAVREWKTERLRTAYARFQEGRGPDACQAGYAPFQKAQASWLPDFALFLALKGQYEDRAWWQWPDADLVARVPAALAKAREELAEEIAFHAWCQFAFSMQWNALRTYATERKVRLIGDIPIYTAHDSADVWAEPHFFRIDPKTGEPESVAGVPPDYFCADGQLWGNPIYDWAAMEADGYGWWIRRMRAAFAQVDILRIDHFRAFEQYWDVPAGSETARTGTWVDGPRDRFFAVMREALGDLPVIAEDLGIITKEVTELRERLGFPGMKILQFAFGGGNDNHYLPHNIEANSVVYTGTHDNDTTRGWYEADGAEYASMDAGALAHEREHFRRYIARDGTSAVWDMIRMAYGSVADTAVLPVQDPLLLGNDARMNRPGTTEGNWRWRLSWGQLDAFPAEYLAELVWLFRRDAALEAAEASTGEGDTERSAAGGTSAG